MTMTASQQFCVNLEHHGGEANSGLTFALIEMLERVGFERRPRRTTLTFIRNGWTVVMSRTFEGGQMVVTFRLRGHTEPIVTVRPAEVRALAQGSQSERLAAIEAALFDVVEALYLATEAAA